MIDHVDNHCAGLEGSADATLSVLGNFSTEVNSPNFTLYQTPFLGLSFPK